MNISLLLPVYYKDNPEFLRQALESIAKQTLQPDEVVVVCDGPIPDLLHEVLGQFMARLPMRIVASEKNMGLAKALNLGIGACKGDWVARFDADDICLPDRLEKQWVHVCANPDTDVLGGAIAEFAESPSDIYGYRLLPAAAGDVRRFARWRNPLNHMTVLFRRDSVIAAGLYPEYHLYEDYVLWVKMLVRGCVIRNLPDVLVLARAGRAMTDRRGGVAYVRSEVAAQRYFYSLGFLTFWQLCLNISIRTLARIVPSGVRHLSYAKILRRGKNV